MSKPDPRVDAFLRHVKLWPDETALLRAVMLATDLVEDYKWGQPCYVFNGRNVALIGGFKDSLRLSFFKGTLLSDPHAVLELAGPHSRSAKFLRFTSSEDVEQMQHIIGEYCIEAIAIEQQGSKVAVPKPTETSLPAELQEAFEKQSAFKDAFSALTPGRQRGYIIYVNSAKQSATRRARVEKSIPRIMQGKGLHDPSNNNE